MRTTTTAVEPPISRWLISIDTTLSRYLFAFSRHCIPIFLLHLLEYSADFASVIAAFLAIALVPSSGPYRCQFLVPGLLGTFLDRVVGRLVRRLVPRSRPVYGGNMSNGVSIDRNSFPSGHASRACFIAVLFELCVVEMEMVGWGVSGWAFTTSLSRVLLGRHHLSDVLAGVCLGALEAVFVFHIMKYL